MLIRTNTPRMYKVKHAARNSDRGVEVTVTAVDESGKGVAGLTAALGTPKGLLDVGQTNADGQAKLVVGGVGQLEPNTAVTTTGYNAETQTLVVQQ